LNIGLSLQACILPHAHPLDLQTCASAAVAAARKRGRIAGREGGAVGTGREERRGSCTTTAMEAAAAAGREM
jgi:hypothetical protein